jgi:hypothetical protein
MTPELTTEAFAALGGPDLPVEAIRGVKLAPEHTLYALHSADGARLAVLLDRDSAMAAAIAHELAPVSVH